MKKFITGCITILVLTSLAHAKPQSPMSAREIVDRMAEVYASCRTYSDEGEVSTGRGDMRFSGLRRQSFSTAFVRPSSFRFELWFPGRKEGEDRYIAWKDGDRERSWWPFNPRQSEAQLETTLLGFATPSQGASLNIPILLLPELFRGRSILTSLDEVRLAGEEKVDGRRISKIEGNFQGQPVKLWIDIREFLVIKIERRTKLGETFELETTIRYKPRVNGDISHDKLAFNPPSDGRSAAANSESSSSLPLSPAGLGRPSAEEAPRLKSFGSSIKPDKDKADRKEKRSKTDDDDIVRVDTDLVLCDVLVLDKQGKWIEGLTEEDFVVKEDDKLQEVGSFSRGDAKTSRRSIVLIIDYSGSQLPYIKTSMEAARTLVDRLNPTDRMAIVTDDVKLLVDFTSDKELLKAKLESLKTSALSGKLGRSEQYDALMATLKELFNDEDLRPIIIFQTDGDQLDRVQQRTRSNLYMLIRTFSLEEVMTAAEKARATIYSIIPGIRLIGFSEEEQLKREKADWENRRQSSAELSRLNNQPAANARTPPDAFLSRQAATWLRLQLALLGIAKYSGGWTDFLERPEQADEIYLRILDDINKRYIIGYYPTNRTRDGKRRKVSIEVRGHPDYIVWGRKTYFAPEPE